MNISQLKCAPCHMGAATVTEAEQVILMQEIPHWRPILVNGAAPI
jgi:hypothetical protein